MNTEVLLLVVVFVFLAIGCLAWLASRYTFKILNKSLLTYSLGSLILAAGAGALMARASSPVYAFYIIGGVALLWAILHILISRRLFKWLEWPNFLSELLMVGYILLLIGAAFIGLYGWFQRTGGSVTFLMLGLLPFLLPILMVYAFDAWIAIPPKIYKKWFYPVERPVPLVELDNTLRLNFMVTKRPDAPVSNRFTVTLPADRTLDELFQYMIYSHNFEEDPEHPIQYHEDNTEGTLLGWIFYRESWWGWVKTYFDPSLSLMRNGLKADDIIIARSFTNN